MARDQELVICPPGIWTEITDGAATEITFQVVSGSVKIRCTDGAAPSDLSDPGYVYHGRPADPQQESGELRIEISQLAADVGANRVYATPINGRNGKVVVDHA
jgi:hypothetical protein